MYQGLRSRTRSGEKNHPQRQREQNFTQNPPVPRLSISKERVFESTRFSNDPKSRTYEPSFVSRKIVDYIPLQSSIEFRNSSINFADSSRDNLYSLRTKHNTNGRPFNLSVEKSSKKNSPVKPAPHNNHSSDLAQRIQEENARKALISSNQRDQFVKNDSCTQTTQKSHVLT